MGFVEMVESFDQFYREYLREEVLELANGYPSEQQSITIDWQNDLYVFDHELADDFLEQPDTVHEAAERALEEFDLPADISLDGATVRIENVGSNANVYDVGEYDTDHIGKLVGIQGQVNQRSEKLPDMKVGVYECLMCGTINKQEQTDDEEHEPHKCRDCDRQGPFNLREGRSEFENTQFLRLQLPPEKSNGHSSEQVDVRLEGDLVNTANPGDRVVIPSRLGVNYEDKEFSATAYNVEVKETDFEEIEFEDHMDEIEEIVSNDPYQQIVDSIAPSLYGYDTIKLAVALQLFGGTTKNLSDGSVDRGDSHMFLVGDPSVGKSEILAYAHRLSPRSIFTDGKGSTAAGLTASAVRDDFGGSEWTIKGGTLVQADKGLACVDELDDMDPEDRSALNTALERQKISVSKAGINATLPARTTLLAAANPKTGRFDSYESIATQIDIHPALLSRFDLIFVMKDEHEENLDREIIGHKTTTARVGQLRAADKDVPEDMGQQAEPKIDEELMRAYIAYAKQEITPVLTDSAEERINDEFFEMRQMNKEVDDDPDDADSAIPVTFRDQEAVIRLAEASARVRLSNEVNETDVERALKLVRKSMKDVGMDPDTGEYDADIVETGTTKSQRQRYQYVRKMIDELDDKRGKACPVEELIEITTSEDYSKSDIEHTIGKLKQKGEVYEPQDDHLRLT